MEVGVVEAVCLSFPPGTPHAGGFPHCKERISAKIRPDILDHVGCVTHLIDRIR